MSFEEFGTFHTSLECGNRRRGWSGREKAGKKWGGRRVDGGLWIGDRGQVSPASSRTSGRDPSAFSEETTSPRGGGAMPEGQGHPRDDPSLRPQQTPGEILTRRGSHARAAARRTTRAYVSWLCAPERGTPARLRRPQAGAAVFPRTISSFGTGRKTGRCPAVRTGESGPESRGPRRSLRCVHGKRNMRLSASAGERPEGPAVPPVMLPLAGASTFCPLPATQGHLGQNPACAQSPSGLYPWQQAGSHEAEAGADPPQAETGRFGQRRRPSSLALSHTRMVNTRYGKSFPYEAHPIPDAPLLDHTRSASG